ncbi:type VI secretion system baseplate subunit TssF [Roseococcus sp. SYP-B2431]|uniref:type VI secretion system baseplate subunit TssF n=1 Tax=Roseococcus sp. SYP-B2431 TaxID=2496640 RepID=UPI0010409FBF|nr:type VI secretion system baseplate subunit TssF [Roseococcus sp. SYP-B2431]TCH99470.1 type VI secretion system baseplate subunit TssF [Roseococcus sp. SYP-B2431]
MSESLLPFYNRELAALRRLAGEFAEAYPKVAGRLRVTSDGTVDDPHVDRLLEGVAFLGGRVQQRLEDELPEITDALLELLSPHLLAPVPSMTTVRLQPKAEARGPAVAVRGTPLETEAVRGEPLRYVTCHEVTLWPVVIEAVRLMGLPLAAPANPRAPGASACLRITLRTQVPDLNFAETGLDTLRLHLRGAPQVAAGLHELLATACVGIALADGPGDPSPTLIGPEKIRPFGFEREQAALPWPRRAFDGHRLLTEYFAHPEKFLYLEIDGLEARTMLQHGNKLEIFVYLNRAAPELERTIGNDTLALHCTPAVNLFPQRCEPIPMDGTQSDWLVIPDARRPAALEIHSIDEVRESRPDGARRMVLPFQRLARDGSAEEDAAPMQWIAMRGPAPASLTGTETRLMLRDLNFDPDAPADGVLTVNATCCNRDLPELLPFGGGQPRLRIAEPSCPAAAAECLSAPTSTLRPRLGERGAWRLVSHLALNHLGVMGGESAAVALREMLRLHDLRDTPETRTAIAALVAVNSGPGVARIPGQRPGVFVRGLEVSLTFEAQAWNSGGLYLLGAVLERFLALQVSVNGFVRTRAYLRGRGTPVANWAPRSGTRVLL